MLNRYSYVLNNPVRYTDPNGHFKQESHRWGTAITLEPSDIRAIGSYLIVAGITARGLDALTWAVANALGLIGNPLADVIAAYLWLEIIPAFFLSGSTAMGVGSGLKELADWGLTIEMRCLMSPSVCVGWFWFDNYPTIGMGDSGTGASLLQEARPSGGFNIGDVSQTDTRHPGGQSWIGQTGRLFDTPWLK